MLEGSVTKAWWPFGCHSMCSDVAVEFGDGKELGQAIADSIG